MLNRRMFSAALGASLAAPSAFAQATWPDRPVKLVVPFGPGGLADVTSRVVCEKLGQKLGQKWGRRDARTRPGGGWPAPARRGEYLPPARAAPR